MKQGICVVYYSYEPLTVGLEYSTSEWRYLGLVASVEDVAEFLNEALSVDRVEFIPQGGNKRLYFGVGHSALPAAFGRDIVSVKVFEGAEVHSYPKG